MLRKLAFVLLLAACSNPPAPRSTGPSTDDRVVYYQRHLDKNPRLYPMWVQLGEAYLDKARETSDVQWLAKAREASAKSMAMQETYGAYYLNARIAGHTHRFEEALGWASKAAAAAALPPDLAVRALQVEMLVGVGRIDEAKALLPAEQGPIEDFYTAAALARIANEEQRLDQAAKLYARAAELARAENATPLVAWAEAMVGGMLLDGGNTAAAVPHLDASRTLGGCAEEAIHRAEYLVAIGRERDGLAAYDRFLRKSPDPSVHHAAYELAAEIGDRAAAERHLAAAERGYRAVIAAGEVHTLGALAQLILDRGGDANEALALATRNLEFKRDREARATLDEAQQRVAAIAGRSAAVH